MNAWRNSKASRGRSAPFRQERPAALEVTDDAEAGA